MKNKKTCANCIYFKEEPPGARCYVQPGPYIPVAPYRPACRFFTTENPFDKARRDAPET